MKLSRYKFLFGLVLFAPMYLSGCGSPQDNKVCFNARCFSVELAKTAAERAKGLMFRKNLDQNKGMLFLYGYNARHKFWMKNTLIPLDIIWIDKNRKVVFIKKNAYPCKANVCPAIKPNKSAMYVLEINAGLADTFGLRKGDKATFHIKE